MNKELMVGKDFVGVSVFALVINKKSEVLLIRCNPSPKRLKLYEHYWSMPGGTIEFGESTGDAIKREIKEETDLDIYGCKLINYNDYIAEGKHWVSLNFFAKTNQKTFQNRETRKIKAMEWFALNNIPKNVSLPAKKCIDLILKNYFHLKPLRRK